MPTFNQESINKDLKKESSDFQKKVISELNAYMSKSSEKMSDYWQQWDLAQANFKGYRTTDKDDLKALSEGKPTKIIVPVTYAQCQTATAFLYSIFTQKDKIFELVGQGPEDAASVTALELDLDYQMRKTQFLHKLYLWLSDINKYGVGILKISWEERYQTMRVKKKTSSYSMMDSLSSLMSGKLPSPVEGFEEEIKEILQYEGNKIQNISPYCFFPDPGLPVARFQEGSFIAHEEIVSRDFLTSQEGKQFHGTKHIREFNAVDALVENRRARWFEREYDAIDRAQGRSKIDKSSVVFTEIQFTLTPKEWTEKFDLPFGDEDKPIKFVAVIANDNKLVKFERLDYLHGQYTYVIAEYNPDHNSFLSSGLAESIRELSDTITWLLNSHMANVRKLINNQVLADSTKIHIEDLEQGKTVIRSKGTPTADMSKSVHQFSVTDATSGHINSIENLMKLVQLTTGVNENALGAYAPGRRSAFESKQVNAGAALRLKTQAMLIWSMGLEPAGQQILANTRQARTPEVYAKIVGDLAQTAPYENTILADPDSLAGSYDLLPYDGTLPSEKDELANYLVQLLTTISSNPQLSQALQLDPKKLLTQIATLKGIRNLKDFEISQNPLAIPQNPANPSPVDGTQPSILPDAEVQAMLAKGQIEPLPEGSNPLASFLPPPQ